MCDYVKRFMFFFESWPLIKLVWTDGLILTLHFNLSLGHIYICIDICIRLDLFSFSSSHPHPDYHFVFFTFCAPTQSILFYFHFLHVFS